MVLMLMDDDRGLVKMFSLLVVTYSVYDSHLSSYIRKEQIGLNEEMTKSSITIDYFINNGSAHTSLTDDSHGMFSKIISIIYGLNIVKIIDRYSYGICKNTCGYLCMLYCIVSFQMCIQRSAIVCQWLGQALTN